MRYPSVSDKPIVIRSDYKFSRLLFLPMSRSVLATEFLARNLAIFVCHEKEDGKVWLLNSHIENSGVVSQRQNQGGKSTVGGCLLMWISSIAKEFFARSSFFLNRSVCGFNPPF